MSDDRFRRNLENDQVLFRQHEAGDCAYVVESGTLEVSVERPSGRHVLAQVGPGSLLGEMALLGDGRRMATVKAVAPCVLRILTREYLGERLELADPLLRHVLHLVIVRYRDVIRLAGHAPETAAPNATESGEARQDQARAFDRLRLQQELELALERDELVLHFQPIVRLEDQSVAGFEALVRWAHPERGMVPPDAFIPLAEESDLILRLGHWVIGAATQAIVMLNAQRPASPACAPMFMTVNLSARQFTDGGLVPLIERALTQRKLSPSLLRLEITESAMLNRIDAVSDLVRKCDLLGVRTTVDDFGTGYSALSYLYRLPVSGVKIARRFIDDLAAYPTSEKVVGAIARLAADLSMDCIAEGIETASQARAAQNLGIKLGQGFYYAAGMPLLVAAKYVNHRFFQQLRGAAA